MKVRPLFQQSEKSLLPWRPIYTVPIMKKEWFAAWFDSPYYYILYKNHDENEAKNTLDRLLAAMQLKPHARVLDLACGKGRHSKYLAEKGYDVTGIDISHSSIAFARQFEHDNLSFYQHDMRLPFRINYYDAVLNMFTSFGYFQTDEDHLRTLKNVAKELHRDGLFLLDFFNTEWVRQHLVPEDRKTVDGIEFHLKKHISGGYVYKSVTFHAENKDFHFREKVRLFEYADFERLFDQAGLNILQTFGNYQLDPFDVATSPRLILIARKKTA